MLVFARQSPTARLCVHPRWPMLALWPARGSALYGSLHGVLRAPLHAAAGSVETKGVCPRFAGLPSDAVTCDTAYALQRRCRGRGKIMSDGYSNEFDDLEPWDEDYEATRPTDMKFTEQLRRYQVANRDIAPLLDAYEIVVFTQIVDRTAGWKKERAIFSATALYEGDRRYGGIARSMHWSRMMKALRSLEDRGVIVRHRRVDTRIRIYRVNYDVDLRKLAATAPSLRKPGTGYTSSRHRAEALSSTETTPSQIVHGIVSVDDDTVAHEDTREGYNRTQHRNLDKGQPVPSEPTAGNPISKIIDPMGSAPAQAREHSNLVIAPPPRTRRRPSS